MLGRVDTLPRGPGPLHRCGHIPISELLAFESHVSCVCAAAPGVRQHSGVLEEDGLLVVAAPRTPAGRLLSLDHGPSLGK